MNIVHNSLSSTDKIKCIKVHSRIQNSDVILADTEMKYNKNIVYLGPIRCLEDTLSVAVETPCQECKVYYL